MRFLGVCMLALLPVIAPAAARQPGQLAAPDTNPVLQFPTSEPKVTVVRINDSRPDMVQRVWIGSICTVVAASAFDAASSWGKEEANPLLASSDGTFGPRGVAIKAGIAGALIVPQILLRRHKRLRIGFTVANFADASVFTAAAVHNVGVAGE